MVGEDIELKYVDELGVSDDKLLETVTQIAQEHCYKLKSEGKLFFSEPAQGNRPNISAPAKTLGEAWENLCISILAFGSDAHTYYDQVDKEGEFKHVGSREAKAIFEIFDPYYPGINRNFPGGIENLVDYGAEVIDGNKDHQLEAPFERIVKAVRDKDSRELEAIRKIKSWKYTYHDRLVAYPMILPDGRVVRINQFKQMLEKLKKEPLSRSVQAITWVPWLDHNDQNIFEDYDSTCFQRWWYRLNPHDGSRGKGYRATLDLDFRSWDLYKASYMNLWAFSMWKFIFDQNVERELEVPIYSGTCFGHGNSLHLYGYYIDPLHPDKRNEARATLNEILKMINKPYESRVFVPNPDLDPKKDRYFYAIVPTALEAQKKLREDMVDIGIDPMKLDYLGRENPLFPAPEVEVA